MKWGGYRKNEVCEGRKLLSQLIDPAFEICHVTQCELGTFYKSTWKHRQVFKYSNHDMGCCDVREYSLRWRSEAVVLGVAMCEATSWRTHWICKYLPLTVVHTIIIYFDGFVFYTNYYMIYFCDEIVICIDAKFSRKPENHTRRIIITYQRISRRSVVNLYNLWRSKKLTNPSEDVSSSVLPSAWNRASSLFRRSPVKVEEVPNNPRT